MGPSGQKILLTHGVQRDGVQPQVGIEKIHPVDPHIAERIAPGRPLEGAGRNLERLLEDGALRESLAGKGIARAARFTWEETARRTLAVYKRLAGEG